MQSLQHLPSEWIDQIFAKLTVRYGREFIDRYTGQDLNTVKADWAEELAGLQNRPEAIQHALNHPTAKAPNVIEFREACNRAPVKELPRLDAPPADPGKLASAIARAKRATQMQPGTDHLTPIRNLMYRELQGDKGINKAQRDFWRIALADEVGKKYGINTRQKFSLSDLAAAMQAKEAA